MNIDVKNFSLQLGVKLGVIFVLELIKKAKLLEPSNTLIGEKYLFSVNLKVSDGLLAFK